MNRLAVLFLLVLAACSTTTSSSVTTPGTPAVLNADGSVQTPAVAPVITTTTTTTNDFAALVDKLATVSIADLKKASTDALAQTPPDTLSNACWVGLQPIVLGIQAQVDAALPPKVTTSTDTVTSTPGATGPTAFYNFQKKRDALQDAAQAAGKLASFLANQKGQLATLRTQIELACGPLFMDVGQDAINPLGKLLNGVGTLPGG